MVSRAIEFDIEPLMVPEVDPAATTVVHAVKQYSCSLVLFPGERVEYLTQLELRVRVESKIYVKVRRL